MDEAVQHLLSRDDPFVVRLLDAITLHFTEDEKYEDFVLEEFCFQLLSVENPLVISPTHHPNFWKILKKVSAKLPYEKQHTDFSIIFGNAEHVLHYTYYYGLLALLTTLMHKDLHRMLRNASGIPQVILVAGLQREGLRRFMINKVLINIEDSVNVHKLYRSGYINSSVLQDLLEQRYRATGESCYETPPPDRPDWRPEVPACMTEANLQPPVFPERSPPTSVWLNPIASTRQRTMLSALYSLLWGNFASMILEFSEALKLEEQPHAPKCRCQSRVFNIDFLMSLLHTIVTQNLDTRALNRPVYRMLFNAPLFAPILSRMETLASNVCSWMVDGNAGSLLEMHIQHHEVYCQTLKYQLKMTFPKLCKQFEQENAPLEILTVADPAVLRPPQLSWVVTEVREWPVQFLLDHLDINLSFLHWSSKLRSFLAKKVRTNFLAYLMERTVSLPLLDHSLLVLQENYGEIFPEVFKGYTTIYSAGKVFLVTEPHTMNKLRLLLLLESATTPQQPIRTELYGNIFMKYFAAVHASWEEQKFAIFCTVSYLAYMLGGKRLKNMVHLPSHDAAYHIYELLPKLLHIFPDIGSLDTQNVIIAFLGLRHDREIDVQAITYFMELTDTRASDLKKLRSDLGWAVNHKKMNVKAKLLVRNKNAPSGLEIYRIVLDNDYIADDNDKVTILRSLHLTQTAMKAKTYAHTGMPYTIAKSNEHWEVDSETYIHQYNTEIFKKMKRRDCYGLITRDAEELKRMSERHFAVHYEGAVKGQLPWTSQLERMNAAILGIEWKAMGYKAIYTRNSVGQLYNNQHRPNEVFVPTLKQPISRGPVCFFEDSFMVYVNEAQWPQQKFYKKGLVNAVGDRSVIDSDTFVTMLLQYNTDWAPGTTTENTVYELEQTDYVRCIRDWQREPN